MALSAAFATELTSEAAPRTVLQAAIVSDPAISAKVVILRNIFTLLSDASAGELAQTCGKCGYFVQSQIEPYG